MPVFRQTDRHTHVLSFCSMTLRCLTPIEYWVTTVSFPCDFWPYFSVYFLTLCGCEWLHVCVCVCSDFTDLGQTLVPVPVSCWLSCVPPLLLSLAEPEGWEPDLVPCWASSHLSLTASPSLTYLPSWFRWLGNAEVATSWGTMLVSGINADLSFRF